MKYTHAISRLPGPNFAEGITTAGLGQPDYDKITQQHEAYIQALESVGLQVLVLEPLAHFPDAYFVEDVALVLPQVAVITLPGAAARRGEVEAIRPLLSKFRTLEFIDPPGLMDGGDVLLTEDHCFIGISLRTNSSGAAQFGEIVERHGYTWQAVPVTGGLHLKSSVNYIAENTLLISGDFSGHEAFKGYEKIVLDKREEYACKTPVYIRGGFVSGDDIGQRFAAGPGKNGQGEK